MKIIRVYNYRGQDAVQGTAVSPSKVIIQEMP